MYWPLVSGNMDAIESGPDIHSEALRHYTGDLKHELSTDRDRIILDPVRDNHEGSSGRR